MSRLWVRLSLAFALFVLLGPLAFGALAVFATRTEVLLFFIRTELTSPGSLTDQLMDYYSTYGDWNGVEEILSSYDLALPRGPEGRTFSLGFTDEGRTLIYGTSVLESADNTTATERQITLPIVIGSRVRGYLTIFQETPGGFASQSENGQAFLIRQISTILLGLATVSALFGLIGGVVISRSLAAPLARLEQTARRFGKRDFTARAEVRGSTELRAVAAAFNEMASDLERAETLRRNLLADVAHELRTPLTVLQGNLQALIDDVYPLEKNEITRLMGQTETLARLVNDLRELAQAEAHQLPLNVSTIDLAALICITAEGFRAMASERQIVLSIETPNAPVSVVAEAGRIQQVISNLIDNALKHTPAGGGISIALTNELDSTLITVSDSGSGIAADHLPHIFDRFYRADRSRSRDTGGSGLGLAIAKAFVELHGGTIKAESAGVPGKGTTFTVRLPHLVNSLPQSMV
jgi:signal transduction histidine kinase